MKKFKAEKIISLDENIIYPECTKCKTELSPFQVSEKILNLFPEKTLKIMKEKNLIYKSNLDKNHVILLICQKCCKGEKLK